MNSIFSEIFRISSLNKFEFKKINDREISFLNDQQINQIRIFGTVINVTTIISEKETMETMNKIYNRIIIDDGSGSISLKSWIDQPINDQISSINNNLLLTLNKLKNGDVIEALGYLRIYNHEIYLSITNIAIHNDLEWEINRRLDLLKKDAEQTYDNYETMLNERYDGSVIDEKQVGLARELARMNLTLNTYTQWYWKTDLLNLMNFLRLRADHHAQYEIRAYADAMLDTVKKWVPITYDAFMDYRVGGTEVSSKGKKIIQKLIGGEEIDAEKSGLSKREWNELMTAFDLKDKLI